MKEAATRGGLFVFWSRPRA